MKNVYIKLIQYNKIPASSVKNAFRTVEMRLMKRLIETVRATKRLTLEAGIL